VAESPGLFKKYGLDIEPVYVRNSTIQMMALTTGEVQLSHTGGAPTLNAVAAGHDLKVVATFGHGVYWDIVSKPEIKSPEDLRGKELGVTNIGGTTWIGAILGLEHFGLNPERDRIKLQSIGDQTVLVQSLTAGRVDAILVEPSFSRDLRKKGFRVLAELSKAKLPFASSGLVTTRGYLQQNFATVESVLKMFLEATAFLHKPANQEIVLRMLSERLKISASAAAKETLQDIDLLIARRPYPDLEGFKNIQRIMRQNPGVARVNVEQIVDQRIYRKLEESRFIDDLYR
jgi:NitT/TauT family transport system substrate-binding protein